MSDEKTLDLNTTLYDMNKGLNLAEGTLKTHEVKDEIRKIIKPFFQDKEDSYFMLLCRERYDFTIFRFTDKNELEMSHILRGVLDCLTNRGDTISIELTENEDAIEIWMVIEGESYVFYLFPYDVGIIEVGR